MVTTPQVRFSAVKKVFPRAHIEIARNKQALAKYVHKEETREREVVNIPTLFEYQTIIASLWEEDEFQSRWNTAIEKATVTYSPNIDDIAMSYLDDIVARDIETGRRGAEFIAINPMWRSSWKKFWRSIIKRRDAQEEQAKYQASGTQDAQDQNEVVSNSGVCVNEADVTA